MDNRKVKLHIEFLVVNFTYNKFQNSSVGAMGISLSRAVQWTTSSSDPGKLEITAINESFLKEILQFVEQFSSLHPQEAKHVFQEPLQWTTTLEASAFTTDYDIRLVQSDETGSWLAKCFLYMCRICCHHCI